MAAETSIKGAWVINAVLLLGCVWFTLNTSREAPNLALRIDRKAADLETLEQLEQERSGFSGYVQAFENLPVRIPPKMETLLANAAPGIPARVHILPASEVGNGWRMERVEVHFESVELEAVGNLLHAVTRQRPPWRLVDCSITAGGRSEGKGSARLVFEALAKSEGT